MITKDYLKTLKQSEVAALFGVDVKTIQRWQGEGLPRHGEGKGCIYVWADVAAWHQARMSPTGGVDVTDKEREQRAKADMAEMEAAEMAGSLIRKDDAVQGWQAFLGRLKQNLLGLADRVAPRLEDGMVLAERKDVIRREVHQSLRDVVAELGEAE